MPKFEAVPLQEIKNAPGMSEAKRKKIEEYTSYINQLTSEMGGRLTCYDDENVITVRNYLKAAVEMANKTIKIRRSGKVISFFLEKKRGRKEKVR